MVPVALAAGLCLGCGALSAPKAQFPNGFSSITVYALNAGIPGAPSGINFLSGLPVPVDNTLQFNIALDIDSLGRVIVYPARQVINGLSGVISVGLQNINVPYADYTQATKNGYTTDSTLVTAVGKTVAFEEFNTTTCTAYSLGTSFYGKFVVDSINPTLHALYVEVATDPNCGYVSLEPGIPTK